MPSEHINANITLCVNYENILSGSFTSLYIWIVSTLSKHPGNEKQRHSTKCWTNTYEIVTKLWFNGNLVILEAFTRWKGKMKPIEPSGKQCKSGS